MGVNLPTAGTSFSDNYVAEEPKYPMWVMKFEDFMNIRIPESHEAYLERGLIHTPSPSETVLFISHQWVSSSHADPRGEQLQVLHEGFRNLMSGEVEIVEAGSDLGSIEKSIVCYAFLVKKTRFFQTY